MFKRLSLFVTIASLAVVPSARAKQPPAQPVALTVCGTPVPPPVAVPPAGSGRVFWQLAPCFEAQGNVNLVDVQTSLYYIQAQQKTSRPSQNLWTPYDESVEKIVREDFQRLWNTKFLDNLSIETIDYTFANGVVGKITAYNHDNRHRT